MSRRWVCPASGLLAGVLLLATPAAADESLPESRLRFEGVERTYLTYRPVSFREGNPVVVVLHGGGGGMRKILSGNSATTRWRELADRDGVLLVVPNGYNSREASGLGDRQMWQDLRPNDGRRANLDDAGFVVAVLDRVAESLPFDRTRVYVAGTSNGGMLAMRLLVEHPETFAAGAAFIASLPLGEVAEPAMATPLFLLNGTDDPLVRYEGGTVATRSAAVRSVEATVDWFARVNGCDLASATTDGLPNPADDGCRATRSDYFLEDAADQQPPWLSYVMVIGGGHSIPNPSPPRSRQFMSQLVGPQCRDFHGVEMAYDYMRQFRRVGGTIQVVAAGEPSE